MSFVLNISGKYSGRVFVTNCHAFEPIVPFIIKVPFNSDFGFTFHTLLIKFSPKVGYTRQKKITRAGDLKGDFLRNQSKFFGLCNRLCTVVNFKF